MTQIPFVSSNAQFCRGIVSIVTASYAAPGGVWVACGGWAVILLRERFFPATMIRESEAGLCVTYTLEVFMEAMSMLRNNHDGEN
jgi:hypothetical protein